MAQKKKKKIRVLCLHGSRQTGEVFRERLEGLEGRIRKTYDADFLYPDGPFALPLEPGQAASLSWLGDDLETSLDRCAKDIDVVLGFSAGASLGGALACMGRTKCAILFSPPSKPTLRDWGTEATGREKILIVTGSNDKLVPPADSRKFVTKGVEVYEHDKGHQVPLRKADVDRYLAFLESALDDESSEEVDEEAEALDAIFGDDYERRGPREFAIKLGAVGFSKDIFLVAKVDDDVTFKIETKMHGLEFPGSASARLRKAAKDACVPGEPSVFAAVTACNDLLLDGNLSTEDQAPPPPPPQTENGDADQEPKDEEEEEDIQEVCSPEEIEAFRYAARDRLVDSEPTPRSKKGSWELSIGVVGKPSAGKSTFFNACTRSTGALAAKTAAYPFTTIDPNVKEALYAVPLDVEPVKLRRHGSFGRDAQNRRLMPVLLKDVAGLCPGAYQGLGKGNRFLNDLVDCDAFVHVVDASGETDRSGQVSDDFVSIDDEVRWVREEIHRWIVGNVASKWRSVIRLCRHSLELAHDRLTQLFLGYHCTPALCHRAVKVSGLERDKISQWTSRDLHRLVAAFLELRFPTVIALNKCDRPKATDNIAKYQGGEPYVRCSAWVDAWLVKERAAGRVNYVDGASTFDDLPSSSSSAETTTTTTTSKDLVRRYLAESTTNTLEVISHAVSLARPSYAFAVADLAEEELRELRCLVLRPGATVNDAYHALHRAGILDGDFVRADALDTTLTHRRTAKRYDGIDATSRVLKIATNKRLKWQS